MKKKLMPLVLLGLLTIGGLAGCGCNETPTTTVETPTTVTTADPTTVDPTTPDPTTPDPTTPDPTTPDPTTPTPTTPSVVHVDSIDLSSDKATLVVGETATLTVTVLPENADDKSYALTTSEDGVVAIDGTTVTAVAAGTVTITATSTDGAKTDTVTITVNNPAPLYKEIPFSLETDLDEKTISYWAAEEVSATTIDNEDGTYGITYTSVDASWVGLQVLYKNSDLVDGQAYLLEWSLNSSVAGNITINGQTVALVAGDNAISIKYVCGTDTSATTALIAQFGTPADGLLADGTLSFSVPTWTETSLHDYDSENWTQVNMREPWSNAAPGEGDYWWFENEPTITAKGNPVMWTNGLVNNTPVAKNYDISFTSQGTSGFPNQYTQHVGVLAWYLNDDNYIAAYCDWNTAERPNGIREFQICGMINGSMSFNDFWGDNPTYSAHAKPLSNENTFSVAVRTNKNDVTVSLTYNGSAIASSTFTVGDTGDSAIKAGIYCVGDDTVTFTNYTYQEVEVAAPTHAYNVYNQGAAAPVFTMNEDGTFGITSNAYKSNLILKDSDLAVGKYNISATFTTTVGYPNTYERHFGLVPWYIDNNNYIVVYAQLSEWAGFENCLREIGIIGRINGTDIEGDGIVGWTDFWTNHITTIDPTKGITLGVTFEGGKISPTINGEAIGYWHADGDYRYTRDLTPFVTDYDFTRQGKVGYYVMGGATEVVTATDVKVKSLETLPVTHEWAVSLPVGDGPTYTVNEDKSIAVTSTACDKANLILSEDINAADVYTVSTTIKSSVGYPNVGERTFGLVPWYVDDNNFVIVYAQYCDWEENLKTCMRELNVRGTIGGQDVTTTIGWKDFWASDIANVDPSVGITLSVTFDNGKLSPSINGSPIGYWVGSTYTYTVDLTEGFPNTDFSAANKVGIFCNAGATEVVTFSGFAVTK